MGGFLVYRPAGRGPAAVGLVVETLVAKEARERKFCRGKLLGCLVYQSRPEIAVWTEW